MKGRQGVKTLIQNPFPFPFEFNSPPRRLKLVSLLFPFCQFPFPFRHLLCRLLYTEGQQIFKAVKTSTGHLTDHCSQYVFVLIRITQSFRKVHACYTRYVPMLFLHCPRQTEFCLYGRHFMYRSTSGTHQEYSIVRQIDQRYEDRERGNKCSFKGEQSSSIR